MVPSTYGVVTERSALRHFTLYQVTLPARFEVPEHCHDCAQLCAVLEGSYVECNGASEARLSPGSVLLRTAKEPHRNKVATEEVHAFLLELDPQLTRTLPVPTAAYFPSARFEPLVNDLRWERDHARTNDRLALEALLTLITVRATRAAALPSSPRPAWLDRAVSHLQAHFDEPMGLATVSARIGVPPGRLAAAFRRHLNTSVGEYLTELRLEFVRQELVRTSRRISEIALDAAFFDESHLGRVFRRRHGMPPGSFRRGHCNLVPAILQTS